MTTRDEFLELLEDYGKAMQEVTAAYEWGGNVAGHEHAAKEAHNLVVAEYDKHAADAERLKKLAHRIATFKGHNPIWTEGDFGYLVELAKKMESD